jgi:hypothetical protein
VTRADVSRETLLDDQDVHDMLRMIARLEVKSDGLVPTAIADADDAAAAAADDDEGGWGRERERNEIYSK